MKKSVYVLFAALAVIAVLSLFAAASGTGGGEENPFAALDSVLMPRDDQLADRQEEQGNDISRLTLTYQGVTVRQVLDCIRSLNSGGWHMKENRFALGRAHTLDLDYNMDTARLAVQLTVDHQAVEWPETLWPSVQSEVPAFPYGRYAGVDEDAPFVGSDSRCFLYSGVTERQIRDYVEILRQAGFERDPDYGLYHSGRFNVDVSLVNGGQARVNVGEDMPGPETVYPPWPVPVDTSYIAMLIDADVRVSQDGNTWYVSLSRMSLEDLSYMVSMAEIDWTPLDEDNRMALPDTSWSLQILAFDSAEQTAVVAFSDSAVSSWIDCPYAVTSGLYLPENALAGAQSEYGAAAQVADWNVIRDLYGLNFAAFMDAAGIKTDIDVWVLKNGQGYDGQRHYLLARIRSPRSNFLAYDKIGNQAWLGSWYGIQMPVLVKLPVDGSDLNGDGTDTAGGDADSGQDGTDGSDTQTDDGANPPEQFSDWFKYKNNNWAQFHYDDNYFAQPSTVYSDSLSTMSLCLAMSAMAKENNNTGGYQPYADRSENVRDLLEMIGFANIDVNHWFTVVPTMDSIGVAAGSKQIDFDGTTFTLLAVAIRGGGYESEWASNFTMGLNGEHQGFSEAKTQVLDYIRSYIAQYQITGNVKLWITGYSRAGATTNLVAAAIDRGAALSPNITLEHQNLFAYCFEPPAGADLLAVTASTLADIVMDPLYNNIFNIVNPVDPVPKLAPLVNGFVRYGRDIELPSPTFDSQYESKRDLMLHFYYDLESVSPGSYLVDDFSMISFIPEIYLPNISQGAQGLLGYLADTVTDLGSDALDLLTSGGEMLGGLWDSYSGPLGDLYDDAAEDVAFVADWLSDGVDAMNDFTETYTGGSIYGTLHTMQSAAHNTALFAGEMAIDGAKAALDTANDLAQAAVSGANAALNYAEHFVADAVHQDVFLDILVSRIALINIATRMKYVTQYQASIREAARMFASDMDGETLDRFVRIFKSKLTQRKNALFSILGSPGDIDTASLHTLTADIITESLQEAGVTQYNAQAFVVLTGHLADMIGQILADNPLLVVSAFYNSEGLGSAHRQELCFAWLMSRDPNYPVPAISIEDTTQTGTDTGADLSTPEHNVCFYADINLGGTRVVRFPGQYAFTHLGMGFPNDSLSCVRIGPRTDGRIKVVLYEHTFFNSKTQGRTLTFEHPGTYNLTDYNFNDKCSSYEIFLIPSD